MNEQEVKELATVKAKYLYHLNDEEMRGETWEQLHDGIRTFYVERQIPEAQAILDAGYSKSTSASLKRISDEEIDNLPCMKRYMKWDEKAVSAYVQDVLMDEDVRLAKATLSGATVGAKESADKQLDTDQKVVAELERQVKFEKDAYADLVDKSNQQQNEIRKLKAKLQPEPQLEEKIKEILCNGCDDLKCKVECISVKRDKVAFSTLIQAEKGKVAKEIFKELKKPCPDRNDGTEKSDCNDCLDKLKSKYSESTTTN